MTQNMYRVGDYVYFETQPSAPYQIRRIEELNKTPTSAVEAKVTCFFRRRDLPNSLLKIADQAERQSQIVSKPRKTLMASKEGAAAHPSSSTSAIVANGENEPRENGMAPPTSSTGRNASSAGPSEKKEVDTEEEDEEASGGHHLPKGYGFAGLPTGAEVLDVNQLHELRQRELFLSRVIESLPATQIRGKCTVVILNEVETCDMYLGHEDAFFYSLVYDPSNQTLLADKGRIELGARHQATIPEMVQEVQPKEVEKEKEKEYEEGEVKEEEEQPEEAMEAMTTTTAEEPTTSSAIQKPDEVPPTDEQPKKEGGGVEVTDRERVVYHPYHSLTHLEIDQFLLVARAVGTFSRALDTSSSTKLPTLHQTASAASRDVTLLHAMALLHQANYDLGQAAKFLVPSAGEEHYLRHYLETDKLTAHNTASLGGPVLCRDQLEEWSASESILFEEAIEKYGKDFHDIRLDCLPWKSMRDIVEYYYMWKTTSRYAELRKAKHMERESKLKQVYIPNYNKPNVNLLGARAKGSGSLCCESCQLADSASWYIWGPAQQLRLCGECWMVWKKRGGLKKPHELETFDMESANDGKGGTQASGPNRLGLTRNGLPTIIPRGAQLLVGQKGRVAFYLNAPLETRVARRMAPKNVFNVRKAARAPFHDIDMKGIQDYYFARPIEEVLHATRQVKRGIISRWAKEHLSKLHKKRAAAMAEQQQQQQQKNGGE